MLCIGSKATAISLSTRDYMSLVRLPPSFSIPPFSIPNNRAPSKLILVKLRQSSITFMILP